MNPRHSASVELVERELAITLFPAHVEATLGGAVAPSHDPLGWCGVPGKAILFAGRRFVMAGSDALLAARDVADVTPDGTPVPAGAPVCTVFARGDSHEECLVALTRRCERILPRPDAGSEAA